MMSFLGSIIFGLIVGLLAKFVMPGKDPGGLLITILLGIAGGILGTWLGTALGFTREGEAAGWILSIIGAVVLLAVYRMIAGRNSGYSTN